MKTFRATLVIGVCLLTACSRTAWPPLTPDELKMLPLKTDLPGDPPKNGMRYWKEPFASIRVHGAYVTAIIRDGQYELWHNTWDYKDISKRQIVVNRGPDIRHLGPSKAVFDASIINDVFEPKVPDQLAPGRGFTRPFMYYDNELGYVLLTCVCPAYLPGSVPLLPAICVSKTGEPGTWTYKGKLKGEPADEAAKRVIWSDGGTLMRLDDGRWRIYLNGFGQKVAAIEADTIDGPWKFLRDADGKIRELLPGNNGGPWVDVLRVRPDEWHLWLTDTWPPQAIWHFQSRDGLTWQLYGRQPEITRAAFGGHGIKCMRVYLDPDGKTIVGLLSIWSKALDGDEKWTLHTSRMPIGLPR